MVATTDLNIEEPDTLISYLKGREVIDNLEQPSVQVLGGGVSNRVVLVRRASGETWVLKQALPKLRVAVDWFSSPERVHREALALRWLANLGLPVPAWRFEDHTNHLLAMDAVPEPHENWKVMLLGGRLEMRHVESFAQILADLHMKSRARRSEIEVAFEDRSFFESLRIEPYFIYAADRVPAASGFLAAVIASTRANRSCLVHGDFSPKNVLVHDRQLILLDHEVAHFGDPAFDLGFSMTHLLCKAHHLVEHRERFEEATLRFWTVYWRQVGGEDWSEGLEFRSVRSTLACLLARVSGRSPVEYLDQSERKAQQRAVLALMYNPPSQVPELISSFVGNL